MSAEESKGNQRGLVVQLLVHLRRDDPRFHVLAAVLGEGLMHWLNDVWWPRGGQKQALETIDALMSIVLLTVTAREIQATEHARQRWDTADIVPAEVHARIARAKHAACSWLIEHELEGLVAYKRGEGHKHEPV